MFDRRGQGAAQVLDRILQNPQIRSNPRVQEVLRLREAGDTEGLQRLGSNICRQSGQSFEDYMANFQKNMKF